MSHKQQLQELQLALQLAQGDLENDERFRVVLREAINVLMLDEREVAHQMGVSRTTINRWKNGNAIPYKLMRKPVYAYLLRRVKSALRKQRDAAETTVANSMPTASVLGEDLTAIG